MFKIMILKSCNSSTKHVYTGKQGIVCQIRTKNTLPQNLLN